MKNVPLDSYDKILEALMAYGYSEEESMQLICDVIEDQRDMDNIAERLHKIYKEDIKKRIS